MMQCTYLGCKGVVANHVCHQLYGIAPHLARLVQQVRPHLLQQLETPCQWHSVLYQDTMPQLETFAANEGIHVTQMLLEQTHKLLTNTFQSLHLI